MYAIRATSPSSHSSCVFFPRTPRALAQYSTSSTTQSNYGQATAFAVSPSRMNSTARMKTTGAVRCG